jgi:hypothetical protein
LAIVDGLAWLQVGKSLSTLTRNVRVIWTYPPFETPPLCICNQEEITTNSEAIGTKEIVGERVGGDKREETSEEEGEVSVTSPRTVSVLRIPTPSS